MQGRRRILIMNKVRRHKGGQFNRLEKHTQLIENNVSKNFDAVYKANTLLNFKCLRSIYTFIVQISHRIAIIKLNLKNYLGNKNNSRVLYLTKIDLHMPVRYLKVH